MKLTRKKLKKIILKEMFDDPAAVTDVAMTVAMIVSALAPLGLVVLHSFLDSYMRGIYTPEDLERIKNSPDPARENEMVLSEKGYEKGFIGIPRKK